MFRGNANIHYFLFNCHWKKNTWIETRNLVRSIQDSEVLACLIKSDFLKGFHTHLFSDFGTKQIQPDFYWESTSEEGHGIQPLPSVSQDTWEQIKETVKQETTSWALRRHPPFPFSSYWAANTNSRTIVQVPDGTFLFIFQWIHICMCVYTYKYMYIFIHIKYIYIYLMDLPPFALSWGKHIFKLFHDETTFLTRQVSQGLGWFVSLFYR